MAAGKAVRTSAIWPLPGQMYGWGQGPTELASARAGDHARWWPLGWAWEKQLQGQEQRGTPGGERGVARGLTPAAWFENSKLGNHAAPPPYNTAPASHPRLVWEVKGAIWLPSYSACSLLPLTLTIRSTQRCAIVVSCVASTTSTPHVSSDAHALSRMHALA